MKTVLVTALSTACVLGAAATLAAGEHDAPVTRTRQVEVQRVVVATAPDGAVVTPSQLPPHAIVIERRSATGEDSSATVRLAGMDSATAIDLDGLEVGDSRDLDLGEGKDATIRRTETGYVLSVDGKEVPIPGDGHLRVMHARPLEGDEDVIVHALPHAIALAHQEIDYENLDALKGLSRREREAAIAALKEILADRHRVMAIAIDDATLAPVAGDGAAPFDRRIHVRTADAPAAE